MRSRHIIYILPLLFREDAIPDPDPIPYVTVFRDRLLCSFHSPCIYYFPLGMKMCPMRSRHIIYILPLLFREDVIPPEILAPLCQYAEIFFCLPVKAAKKKNLHKKVADRINDSSNNYQVNASDVLQVCYYQHCIESTVVNGCLSVVLT